MKKVFDNRGEGYIDTVVSVVCAMMVIVLALNVFSLLTIKQDLDYFAKQMISCAATYGKTTSEITTRYNELCEETGLSPSYSFAGTKYFNSQLGRIQLGETIVVTLTYSTGVKGFGAIRIPITLTAKHSGLSQKYWK